MLRFDVPGTDFFLTLGSSLNLRPNAALPNEPAVYPGACFHQTAVDLLTIMVEQICTCRQHASRCGSVAMRRLTT